MSKLDQKGKKPTNGTGTSRALGVDRKGHSASSKRTNHNPTYRHRQQLPDDLEQLRSPLVTSRNEVEALIARHYAAIYKIVSQKCPDSNYMSAYVPGIDSSEVTQDVCERLIRNWPSVPREPGFFKFVKTLARRRVAELWARHVCRGRLFELFEAESKNV